MSVTDVQHVYIRHAHTCIRPASGVLTEDMLTPAACMIMPELNMLTPAGYMIIPELNMLTSGLRKLNDFFMFRSKFIKFCKNHALKSSRTFVVNLFNEINSINQSNLFNLFELIAATGSRKLKEFWPKNFVTNCFNYSSNWGFLVFFDYPSRCPLKLT